MELIQEKQKKAFDALKERFHYRNRMQTPRLLKAVVAVGVGSLRDKKKIELVEDRLAKITGQKAAPRGAKKAIATFKTRQGDIVGLQVTLRGKRMNDFVNKLLHIALPRTKDFKGVTPDIVDAVGNATVGIKEHIVFPETADEELKDVFGMGVTLVTTAKKPEEAQAYLEHLGFPFKKK